MEFVKNLLNSYNDTLIIKIGITEDYDITYLFNNIVMKYGGNYLLCDSNKEKIAEIKQNFGSNSQVYIEEPFIFIVITTALITLCRFSNFSSLIFSGTITLESINS